MTRLPQYVSFVLVTYFWFQFCSILKHTLNIPRMKSFIKLSFFTNPLCFNCIRLIKLTDFIHFRLVDMLKLHSKPTGIYHWLFIFDSPKGPIIILICLHLSIYVTLQTKFWSGLINSECCIVLHVFYHPLEHNMQMTPTYKFLFSSL